MDTSVSATTSSMVRDGLIKLIGRVSGAALGVSKIAELPSALCVGIVSFYHTYDL